VTLIPEPDWHFVPRAGRRLGVILHPADPDPRDAGGPAQPQRDGAPGIAGVAEVFGALVVARLHLRNLALTAVLAWVLLGAFRLPLGLATSPLLAAALLAITGFASALTDIPLIALVQQRIPDRHLAKALGLWEAGIAGAIAIAPVIATTIIDNAGVSTGFMLSGAALIAIGTTAALALNRTRGSDTVSSAVGGHMRAKIPVARRPRHAR